MTSTRHTLTGNLRGQAGALPPGAKILGAYVITNIEPDEVLTDYDTGEIQLGSLKLTVATSGVFTQPGLLATDSDDISHSGFRYAVVVDYINPRDQVERTWTSPWFELEADRDLATAVNESFAPPTALSLAIAQLQALVAAGQLLLDDQIDLSQIATPDALVAALALNTGGVGPLTSAALTSSYAAKRPAAPNIVIDSDSQGRGPLNSSAGAGLDLQTQVTAGIDPRATINNFAVGGQTVATMTADAVAQIDSLYSSSALANVVILWGGTNDIFFGASAATTYARIVAYHTARRAAGFKTVAVTLLPRSDAGTPVGYEAARISVNTSIRTNWATFADALADIAVDTRIGDSGDETDTAYYADLVHMTGRGYAIVADLIKRALSTLGIANAGPKTDTYASRINDFIVPARALGPVSGAPVQGMATLSSRDAWDLRDGFTDGVGAVVSIPEDWPRFSVSLLWATTTNTTNVVLRMDRQALGAGQNLLTGTNAGAATIVPCLAGYLLTETQLRNSVLDINVPSHRFWIQVLRLGTNGSDVNTEPVSVLGFLIKREIV